MKNLCAKCNICTFMPKQEHLRVLRYWWGHRTEDEVDQDRVLVIDDCPDKRDVVQATEVARNLLLGEQFTYTNTIRCDYMSGELNRKQLELALSRCSVWTHQLLENRMLIISTLSGLSQMQIESERVVGDMWRNNRLGVILCISPLLRMLPREYEACQAKIQRVLKTRELA